MTRVRRFVISPSLLIPCLESEHLAGLRLMLQVGRLLYRVAAIVEDAEPSRPEMMFGTQSVNTGAIACANLRK